MAAVTTTTRRPRSRCCCCPNCTDARPRCVNLALADIVSCGTSTALLLGSVTVNTEALDDTVTIVVPSGDGSWHGNQDDCNALTTEDDTIALTGSPTGGTFRLGVGDGLWTDPIAYDADGTGVKAALDAAPFSLVGTTVVTGPAGGPWNFTYDTDGAGLGVAFVADAGGLTGGTDPGVTITRNVRGGGAVTCKLTGRTGSAQGLIAYTRSGVPLLASIVATIAFTPTDIVVRAWVEFEDHNGASDDALWQLPIFLGSIPRASATECFTTSPLTIDNTLSCGDAVCGTASVEVYSGPLGAGTYVASNSGQAQASGGTATVTFAADGDDNCPPAVCRCQEGATSYDVQPQITAPAPGATLPDDMIAYAAGGADLPAGIYCVSYKSGAIDWSSVYDSGTWYRVNRFGQLGRFCFKVVHSNGTVSVTAPGKNTGYLTQAAVEAANAGQSITISHTGGPIGIWCDDTFLGSPPDYHYDDNAVEPDGSSPTWSICKIAGGPTQLTECPFPEGLSTCCTHYAVTIAGSSTLDDTYNAVFDAIDSRWFVGIPDAAADVSIACVVIDGLSWWQLSIIGDGGPELIYRAPAYVIDGLVCPPTDGWTLTTNTDGGSPVLTLATSGC